MAELLLGNMTFIWVAAIIVFIVIEIFTQGLTSIWFAGGALGGCISAMVGAGPLVQVIVFIIVSILLIIATRPFKKKLDQRIQKTNVETVVGKTAVVEEEIRNGLTGRVRLEGKIWTARSDAGNVIPAGEQVKVTDIQGVTLTVQRQLKKGDR